MFPVVDLDKIVLEINNEEEKSTTVLGSVILMDFSDSKKVVKIENGRPVLCQTNKEKVEVYIKLLLRTHLDKYKVDKNTGFGMTYFNYRGMQLPQGFLESELKRELEEKLRLLNIVDDIIDFYAGLNNNTLHIEFTILLYDGTTLDIEEVI